MIYKLWGNNKMVKTYPNVTIRLSTGEDVLAKKYYPDIKPYFLKFRKQEIENKMNEQFSRTSFVKID